MFYALEVQVLILLNRSNTRQGRKTCARRHKKMHPGPKTCARRQEKYRLDRSRWGVLFSVLPHQFLIHFINASYWPVRQQTFSTFQAHAH